MSLPNERLSKGGAFETRRTAASELTKIPNQMALIGKARLRGYRRPFQTFSPDAKRPLKSRETREHLRRQPRVEQYGPFQMAGRPVAFPRHSIHRRSGKQQTSATAHAGV